MRKRTIFAAPFVLTIGCGGKTDPPPSVNAIGSNPPSFLVPAEAGTDGSGSSSNPPTFPPRDGSGSGDRTNPPQPFNTGHDNPVAPVIDASLPTTDPRQISSNPPTPTPTDPVLTDPKKAPIGSNPPGPTPNPPIDAGVVVVTVDAPPGESSPISKNPPASRYFHVTANSSSKTKCWLAVSANCPAPEPGKTRRTCNPPAPKPIDCAKGVTPPYTIKQVGTSCTIDDKPATCPK